MPSWCGQGQLLLQLCTVIVFSEIIYHGVTDIWIVSKPKEEFSQLSLITNKQVSSESYFCTSTHSHFYPKSMVYNYDYLHISE